MEEKSGENKQKENGIKKQIIKKTEERRITHPKKIKNTREQWEMMNNGLINVLNILSTDYTKIRNF